MRCRVEHCFKAATRGVYAIRIDKVEKSLWTCLFFLLRFFFALWLASVDVHSAIHRQPASPASCLAIVSHDRRKNISLLIGDGMSVAKVSAALTYATPAGFAAHAFARSDQSEIALWFLKNRIDVLLWGGWRFFPRIKASGRIRAIYCRKRLRQGMRCHSARAAAAKLIPPLLAFDSAVREALDFAQSGGNTLLAVTADHETGGIALTVGRRKQSYSRWPGPPKDTPRSPCPFLSIALASWIFPNSAITPS